MRVTDDTISTFLERVCIHYDFLTLDCMGCGAGGRTDREEGTGGREGGVGGAGEWGGEGGSPRGMKTLNQGRSLRLY